MGWAVDWWQLGGRMGWWQKAILHTCLLASLTNGLVVFVKHNADLVEKPDLLLVVLAALESIGARVDVGEESQNSLSRHRLVGRRCGCGRRHEGRTTMDHEEMLLGCLLLFRVDESEATTE